MAGKAQSFRFNLPPSPSVSGSQFYPSCVSGGKAPFSPPPDYGLVTKAGP